MNDTEEFHKNCGEVLRLALHIETSLEFFITHYFCFHQGYKELFFKDLILIPLGFQRKINIFREICKEEDINKERIKEVSDAINFVRNIRNSAAHWDCITYDSEKGPEFQKRTSKIFTKDNIKLDSQLVKEIDEKHLFAIKKIFEIYKELIDLNRIKKIKVI